MDSSAKTSTEPIAVGGAVQAKCGKCKAETKHTILALVDEAPSKVRCTICESDHKFRKPPKPRAAKKPKVPKENPEVVLWAKLSPKWDTSKATAYSMKKSYEKSDIIKQKSFGVGQVQQILGAKKMSVLFEVGIKLMVCSQ